MLSDNYAIQGVLNEAAIPSLGQFDVIVAGGGAAGVSAATNIARKGHQVLMIERISQKLMSTGRFAKWQLPDDVVTLKALPRTVLGKLDRQALRQTFKNHFQPNPD